MSAVIETEGLGRKYGRRWGLHDCTLTIPEGKVVGLVGPNGAGKTTLLHLAVGLLAPTSGNITVLGCPAADGSTQLGRVGFVAQDTSTYARLSVAEHLRMGAWLNQTWDAKLAEDRMTAVTPSWFVGRPDARAEAARLTMSVGPPILLEPNRGEWGRGSDFASRG